MRWAPVTLGVVVELVVIAVGVLLPLSSDGAVRTFLALGLLNVGVLGGAVTGVLVGRSWRPNARHGLATGAIGGAVLAGLLFGTVTDTLPSVRYSGLWTIHYLIATEVPTPSWMVVRYGRLVVAGIALALGTLVAMEAAIAAGAVASTGSPPPIDGRG